jgi:uncharacterized DUF497 family protein
MEFDWHDAKHEKNLQERGFGFDFAAQIFLGRVLTQVDDRDDYGELRIKAIGEVDGIVLVAIYTDRDDVRWIISARKANKKERALWLA